MKRKVIITATTVAAIVVAIALTPDRWDKLLALVRWAESAPQFVWPLFLVTFVLAIVLMLPAWIFMVIGGYLFGMPVGALLSFIANLAGSVAAFYLAKNFARHGVEAKFSQSTRFQKFDAAVARNGFTTMLFARLALLPYNFLNYACGLTGMRVRDFVFGTALGTLPILLAHVFVGASTVDLFTVMAEGGLDAQRPPFELLLALIAVIALVMFVARRFRRRIDVPASGTDTEAG